MLDIENYRRVRFQLNCANLDDNENSEYSLDESINQLLDSVNKNFKPDELRIFRNGSDFELWLRELEIDKFEDAIVSLTSTSIGKPDNLNKIQQEFATRLQSTVNGIGSYGIRGKKRLYAGFNKERKVEGRKRKEIRRGKHYYANDHDFSKETNILPIEFQNTIVQGDSELVLKKLPDNCIDLVFTSPPYNFGLNYSKSDDANDWSAYFKKLFGVFDECIRVLKFGGRLVVNVQPLYSDYIPSHHIISNHLMHRRMIWKGEILWEKNNYNCKYTAWGSWKSPSSPYLKYTWEFLEIFCKGELKKSGSSANADISVESFKKWVVGKWSIAPERKMKQFNHPAMFPEELANRVLLLFSFRGDTILDPFAGAGTTCVVAKKNHRQFLGIDISAEYCKTAETRLSDIQQ